MKIRRQWGIVLASAIIGSALLSTPAVAQAEEAGAPDKFLCVQPLDICQQAIRAGNGSAERSAEYLRELTTLDWSNADYGVTTNPGLATLRHYGWQLSLNGTGRYYDLYLCDGSGCVYQGQFAVQNRFNLNGRQVKNVTGVVTSDLTVSAQVAQSWWCREMPSALCGEHHTAMGSLPKGGTNKKTFTGSYLSKDRMYDQAFQIMIKTHPDAIPALTPVHDSLNFRCTKDPELIYPGECYYPNFAMGDAR